MLRNHSGRWNCMSIPLLAGVALAYGLSACGSDFAAPPGAPKIDLSVSKSAARGLVRARDTVRFTVTVRNRGPREATQVFGGDTLPAGLTYTSHTTSRGTYSATTGLWSVGTVAVNEEVTLSILATAQVSAVGDTVVNRAGVASTALNLSLIHISQGIVR